MSNILEELGMTIYWLLPHWQTSQMKSNWDWTFILTLFRMFLTTVKEGRLSLLCHITNWRIIINISQVWCIIGICLTRNNGTTSEICIHIILITSRKGITRIKVGGFDRSKDIQAIAKPAWRTLQVLNKASIMIKFKKTLVISSEFWHN